jgi:hypothetical protein
VRLVLQPDRFLIWDPGKDLAARRSMMHEADYTLKLTITILIPNRRKCGSQGRSGESAPIGKKVKHVFVCVFPSVMVCGLGKGIGDGPDDERL